MNTQQLQNALKAAQETVRHLTEIIEGLERKINPDLLNIRVEVANEDEYNAIREVLEREGVKADAPAWTTWQPSRNYVVVDDESEQYYLLKNEGHPSRTRYTFKRFMTKYAK
jgi:hypothetical protein